MKSAGKIAGAIIGVGIVGAVVWSVYSPMRESALRQQSRDHLKQIGLALFSYHERWNSFPPAYVPGPDGKPWHSWRVLLLPYLDQRELYAQYHFDEPSDGPRNRALLALRPEVYMSPLRRRGDSTTTHYLGVQSRRTMWPAYFPVHLADVKDGSSNTLHLLEDVESQIPWTAPQDMSERDAVAMLASSSAKTFSRRESWFHALAVDGSVRAINRETSRELFVSLLTPQFRQSVVADKDWPAGLLAEGQLSAANLPTPVDPATLSNTCVQPSPDAPLDAAQSAVYCATFQLAWDKLRPAIDQPVVVKLPTFTTNSLNAHPFPVSDLSADAYFVGRSPLGSDAETEMWNAFRARFQQSPAERPHVNPKLTGEMIFAYLQKSMPFRMVLEKSPAPLTFYAADGSTAVRSFGKEPKAGDMEAAFPETLAVCDYNGPDDFILKLMTDSRQRDDIFIARVAPDATLRETWDSVLKRLQKPQAKRLNRQVLGIDTVQIPVLSFGLIARFEELLGTDLDGDRFISDARQAIQFQLDEKGAELIADAYLIIVDFGDDPADAFQPRQFRCDRPFLLALRERDAETPYLLAWIGNDDLMQPAVETK
ncbi:MAG: DUF1559 domain-containing protein [Planctomycetaceae bacterium]|nr:DUF1559 domain-containing protein [Planctomycetaceae bacterium]